MLKSAVKLFGMATHLKHAALFGPLVILPIYLDISLRCLFPGCAINCSQVWVPMLGQAEGNTHL